MISICAIPPEEADALSQIALAAKRYWGYPERWIEIWSLQLTFSPAFFILNEGYMAVVDGHIAGFYTILESNDTISIENLWVLPVFMGMSVGRSLFLHAVGLTRERGYHTLTLDSDPNAVGFYEKMGMYQVGKRCSEVDGQSRCLPIMEMKV